MVLLVYGAAALPPVITALYHNETGALVPLAAAAFLCIVTGGSLRHFLDLEASGVRPRVNYITVIINWLVITAITTAVYFLSPAGLSFTDSLFEAVASLTTTGTGSLGADISLYSLMLWRSNLNWLGGVGIILISYSCISSCSFSGRSLVSIEFPGHDFLNSSSRSQKTYRMIIMIYAALTALHFVILAIAGMPAFTSLLTALSNISTAGLQHINSGVITGLSLPLRIIITVFAFLGSLNVSFFILLFTHRIYMLRRRSEVKTYSARILVTALITGISVALVTHRPLSASLGDALMQTVSFLSTSGYIAADCSDWPLFCVVLIVLQVFFGACAASTGGGIKNARLEIGVRTVDSGLFRSVHPRAYMPVKYNRTSLKTDQLVQTNLFIALFMLIYVLAAVFLSLDNKNESILDALSYSQAMITNTGMPVGAMSAPGFAADFSPLSRIVMSVEMLCGRLEIYPVLMLFSRSFWRSDSSRV